MTTMNLTQVLEIGAIDSDDVEPGLYMNALLWLTRNRHELKRPFRFVTKPGTGDLTVLDDWSEIEAASQICPCTIDGCTRERIVHPLALRTEFAEGQRITISEGETIFIKPTGYPDTWACLSLECEHEQLIRAERPFSQFARARLAGVLAFDLSRLVSGFVFKADQGSLPVARIEGADVSGGSVTVTLDRDMSWFIPEHITH